MTMQKQLKRLGLVALISLSLVAPTLGADPVPEAPKAAAAGTSKVKRLKQSLCITQGCSGEFCNEETHPAVGFHCEVKPEVAACYKKLGVCTRVKNQCGWKESPKLVECLEKARQKSPDAKDANANQEPASEEEE